MRTIALLLALVIFVSLVLTMCAEPHTRFHQRANVVLLTSCAVAWAFVLGYALR